MTTKILVASGGPVCLRIRSKRDAYICSPEHGGKAGSSMAAWISQISVGCYSSSLGGIFREH